MTTQMKPAHHKSADDVLSQLGSIGKFLLVTGLGILCISSRIFSPRDDLMTVQIQVPMLN